MHLFISYDKIIYSIGHPGREALIKLASVIPTCIKLASVIPMCPSAGYSSICHACELGRHVRLPFSVSLSRASHNFDLIHCDLWTSSVVGVFGFKYYLVILDDCSHYLWTFPLRFKSDTYTTLTNFFAHVHTQFGTTVKAIKCDNGKEFDNFSARTFFLTCGIHLRMSCPCTSAQNGNAERIIHSTNNVIRLLLFQASAPPYFWVEAPHTATHLLNLLPTKTLNSSTPHLALFGTPPAYDHLRVFGCKCYLNLCHHCAQASSSLCYVCLPRILCSPQRLSLPWPCLQRSHHLASRHFL